MCFEILLLGNGVSFSEDIVKIIRDQGTFLLGARRSPFQVEKIQQGVSYDTIWSKSNGILSVEALNQVEILRGYEDMQASHCSMQFVTPLRIRRNGELLLDIDFPTIIRNITRRITEISERYDGYVDETEAAHIRELAKKVNKVSSGMYQCYIERYSSRRDQKMDFSGLLGAMTFEGEITPFVPWLNAIVTLHIGRNVTFGYGKAQVIIWP